MTTFNLWNLFTPTFTVGQYLFQGATDQYEQQPTSLLRTTGGSHYHSSIDWLQNHCISGASIFHHGQLIDSRFLLDQLPAHSQNNAERTDSYAKDLVERLLILSIGRKAKRIITSSCGRY